MPLTTNPDDLPPVPEGVYYNHQDDNFYKIGPKPEGMGVLFYTKWSHRYEEFPTGPRPEEPKEVKDLSPELEIAERELLGTRLALRLIANLIEQRSYDDALAVAQIGIEL